MFLGKNFLSDHHKFQAVLDLHALSYNFLIKWKEMLDKNLNH